MKKVLLGLALCLFAICNTGCSAIDGILDDYLNYSTVTIEYDSRASGVAFDYSDLKVSFGENEYNAIGVYKVPKGTVISLSWAYSQVYAGGVRDWCKCSEEISIGTNKNITITIYWETVTVTTHE